MAIKKKTFTSGIYKITSPTGRLYIGQSKSLELRIASYKYYDREYRQYIKMGKKSLILNSLKKYGYEQHKFEIIDICDISILNEREIYYIELFKTYFTKYPEFNGLNLHEGGTTPPKIYGPMSDDTKLKISNKLKLAHLSSSNYENINKKRIIKYSLDNKLLFVYDSISDLLNGEKISISVFRNCFLEHNKGNFNNCYFSFENPDHFRYDYVARKNKLDDKTRRKNEIAERKYLECCKKQQNKELKEKQKAEKLLIPKKPKKTKEEWSIFFKNLNTGRKMPNRSPVKDKTNIIKHLKKVHKSFEKPVVQYTRDGEYVNEYESMKDAANAVGGSYQGIYRACSGRRPTAHGFKWKYKTEHSSQIIC